ncbi:uncharacterized protein JCM15063_002731 [Sporobolomyces koalae]|uniref:uncharacterized protein n=1 Tax=Sporobolomyces koalae TaxID=500713 RepID=UPI00318127A2
MLADNHPQGEKREDRNDDKAVMAIATAVDPKDAVDTDPSGTGSSTLAALSRTLIATLAFLFKRPIRLFRPVKISTWAGIQAIANEQGQTVNRQFVRSLIKKEGWRFIPRHILPPMVVNAMIGLTLFTTYTTSERALLPPSTPTFAYEFIYVPFVSGSLAGAVQSILSTPLDNARLLLLRRQRFLSVGINAPDPSNDSSSKRDRRKRLKKSTKGAGIPFVSWAHLLKQSLFVQPLASSSASPLAASTESTSHVSVNPRDKLGQKRIELARTWARKSWSLFSLTLVKDSIGFGLFFTIFELGREGSKQIAYAIDRAFEPSSGRIGDNDQGDIKTQRTGIGLIVQSIGILLSGGIAGWVFSLVSRPFERMRNVVWEGKSQWAAQDAKLQAIQERVKLEQDGNVVREQRKGRSIGGKSERRARKLLGTNKRKIGMVRIGQIRTINRPGTGSLLSRRRVDKHQHAAKRVSSAAKLLRPAFVHPAIHPSKPVRSIVRTPPPSSPSLILAALSRYGPITFLFGSRQQLRLLDTRLPRHQQVSSTLAKQPDSSIDFKPLTATSRTTTSTLTQTRKNRELNGPTRFIAKRRFLQETRKLHKSAQQDSTGLRNRGLRIVSRVFTFVPPYAVGFLVYALVQGDLKAEV